jgi:hypothetical protein
MARRHDFALGHSSVHPVYVSEFLPTAVRFSVLALTLGSLEQRLHTDSINAWTALSASAFRRVAVENSDGYTILSIPEKARTMGSSFVSWDFIGASLCT